MKKTCLVLMILLLSSSYTYSQTNDIYRISEQQKIFELSMIWKELSYNFANMDNCEVDLDSLYLAYIPIIQKTENDVDYCNAIKRFMAHFNNGHTYANYPSYLLPHISYPGIETELVSDKILIKNAIIRYMDKLEIGDEIITINEMGAIDYFKAIRCPYVGTSNLENKLPFSMFGMLTLGELRSDSLKLEIKKKSGIHTTVVIYHDFIADSSKSDFAIPDRWLIEKYSKKSNFFIEDTLKGWAYARLNTAGQDLSDFCMQHYQKILNSKNFIVDLSMNSGGGSDFFTGFINLLINADTIRSYPEYTRNNNALHKAWASVKIHYYEDSEVPEFYKVNYYPYYFNSSFEIVKFPQWENRMPSLYRYQGNVYVIIDHLTASAAEYFALMLSQNPNICFLGKKTNGALGQPLVTKLPSGITFFMNSTKTYDFKDNDISSGFAPNYEYDFSALRKIDDPDELLKKFVETILKILDS